jgi:hypothetical protein
MRSVLEEPGLSKKEQRALRRKLKADRDVLRSRVARAEPEAEAQAPTAKRRRRQYPERRAKIPHGHGMGDGRGVARPALLNALQTGQLRRRIAVYRDAMASAQYPQEERDYWRSSL